MSTERHLPRTQQRRWARLIYVEIVILAVLLALLFALVIVGIEYEHSRIFTNASLIIVFGSLLAEITRRVRHFRENPRLNRPDGDGRP